MQWNSEIVFSGILEDFFRIIMYFALTVWVDWTVKFISSPSYSYKKMAKWWVEFLCECKKTRHIVLGEDKPCLGWACLPSQSSYLWEAGSHKSGPGTVMACLPWNQYSGNFGYHCPPISYPRPIDRLITFSFSARLEWGSGPLASKGTLILQISSLSFQ